MAATASTKVPNLSSLHHASSKDLRGDRNATTPPRASGTEAKDSDQLVSAAGAKTVGQKNDLKAPFTFTQNPESNILVRGLKGAWNIAQQPIFKVSAGKDDFFYTPKTLINKVWTWKPVWAAGGAVGGGIAAGVIFGIIYKAVLIGAVSSFMTSHAGWATAAAVGAVLVAVGVVCLFQYAQHQSYLKSAAAHAKSQAVLAGVHKENAELKAQLHAIKTASDGGYARGLGDGIAAGRAEIETSDDGLEPDAFDARGLGHGIAAGRTEFETSNEGLDPDAFVPADDDDSEYEDSVESLA